MRTIARVLLACAALAGPLAAQDPYGVPNAPKDQPLTASSGSDAMRMFFAMEPYVAHARASWPEARRRFLAGLPRRHSFFVTTRLRDHTGRIEQAFVAVDSVSEGRIYGRIWSQILVVDGYRLGQPYDFPETDLIDWMIARPDGTTEGNIVGRFLDLYRP
jgi:uncharacterized protein YegJ (DUF2314 family)